MGYNRGADLSTDKAESLHSRSKNYSPDDEILTWLQYPLDFTHERGYCSELFGRLTSSSGSAKPGRDQGVPVSMENHAGKRGISAVSENAKDALALGAGRASGIVLPEGAEAFNKVKTIMQQGPCLQSSIPHQKASSVGMRHENCEPFHAPVQSWGLATTSLPAEKYPVHGSLHNFSTDCLWSSFSPSIPSQDMDRLQPSKERATGSTLCETSHIISAKGLKKGADFVQTQITHTHGSNYSLITEDHIRDTSLCAASAPVSTALYDAGMSVRLAPDCTGRKWQETSGDMHAEVPDVFAPSCSGGSHTSAEMSAKETSSLGKQKVEDYNSQSKNAEVDSAEINQPHRRTSKRSRVAESHNLSEKRRRNRINEKLKTLQELIPNSSKTDKASILDEAIEYLKALQSQLQIMSSRSGMKLSPMGFPPGMQHIHMGHTMGLGFPLVHAGMGFGMGMGLVDLPSGLDGRPIQALSAAAPHFNLGYPATAPFPTQTCSQPYLTMEVPSSTLWPLQQPSAQQAYQQVYTQPQSVSSLEQGEQLSTPRVSKDG